MILVLVVLGMTRSFKKLVFYVLSRLGLLVALEEFSVCGVFLDYMLFLNQNITCISVSMLTPLMVGF